jgi:peptidoglycan/LPS O-acetylase OafA/YrhL
MTAPRAQMTRSPSRGFRPDIEGLRAIAILLVVGYHAGIPGLSGGFVGVDIFFVLSGYLITRLLVGEIDSSGTIDFGRFYARRARRLLPALTLTVLVTVMAGALIYPPSEVTQGGLATTAMSTAAYVSNLFFVRWGDDYFAPSPEKNPLLHTWSLSVEEQFYLVWPLFVIFALKLLSFSSPRKASQGRLLWWMAAAGVLSFALSLYWTTAQRSWAFYTMPGRAWEFAVGGLGVLFPATALRAVRRIPPFWGWAGIAGILLAATTLNKSTSFPGIAVLLPALSTILVLCAGAERENSFLSRILRTQPLQDIGSLSYSWYLWHWPVLTLGLALIPVHSVLVRVALVTLALGLSVLSYRVIENPIRESRKLAGSKRYSFAMVALLALIGISTSFAWRKVSVLKAAEPGQLRFDIAHKDYAVSLLNDKCTTDVFETQVKSCSFGIDNSPNTIVLFGDSHAAQWFPALEPISKTRGFRLVTLVKLGCGAVDAPIYNDRGRFNVECGQWREKALQKIAQMNPALTVVTSSEKYRLTDEQWRNGTDSVVKNLAAASQEVLILRDTPAGDFDIPSCLARRQWRPFFVPASSCQFSFSRTSMIYDFEIAAAARYKNVMTADLSSRICPSGICTGLRGNLVMYRDNDHLTASFARTLERDLDVQIDRALHRTPRILNVAANPL